MGRKAVEYLLQEEAFELMTAVSQTFSVCGIDHPDECVCLLKVVLPVRAESLLASDVPCHPVSQGRDEVSLATDRCAVGIFPCNQCTISIRLASNAYPP